MKHTEKIVLGFYSSKSGREYPVVTDKYSGNNYRVLKGPDHIVGKTLQSGHRFRRARKSELSAFE